MLGLTLTKVEADSTLESCSMYRNRGKKAKWASKPLP